MRHSTKNVSFFFVFINSNSFGTFFYFFGFPLPPPNVWVPFPLSILVARNFCTLNFRKFYGRHIFERCNKEQNGLLITAKRWVQKQGGTIRLPLKAGWPKGERPVGACLA